MDHLRKENATLASLLEVGEAMCHPFVVGEIACGRLRNRREILPLLQRLPQAPVVEHQDVLGFLESHRLMGTGLGWIDVHLLAAALLARAPLWTLDRALRRAATKIGVA